MCGIHLNPGMSFKSVLFPFSDHIKGFLDKLPRHLDHCLHLILIMDKKPEDSIKVYSDLRLANSSQVSWSNGNVKKITSISFYQFGKGQTWLCNWWSCEGYFYCLGCISIILWFSGQLLDFAKLRDFGMGAFGFRDWFCWGWLTQAWWKSR